MIFKNSLLLAALTAASLLLGVIRDRLLATHIGIGPILDVYNAAFRIPDLLYGILFAFVTAGTVVPFLTKENKEGNIVDPRQKLYSLSLFFGGVLTFLIVCIGLTLPLYAKYIVPGFTEAQVAEFIFATRILLIQPLFLGISSLISCFAQLKNEFLLFGLSPLGYSLSIIVSVLYVYPVYGLQGLLIGVVVGSIVSLCIQSMSLYKAKLGEIRYHYAYHHIRDLTKTALPRTGTNITSQIRAIFFMGVATTFGGGVLTSYLFAQRITEAFTQLIQQSITTASLPVLSKDFLEGKHAEYEAIFKKYITLLLLAGIITSIMVFVFRDSIIVLLYGETGFTSTISYFLIAFLVILPFTMISGYISISLYAMKNTRDVFISFLLGTILSIVTVVTTYDSGVAALRYGIFVWGISQVIFLTFFYLQNQGKRAYKIR